MQTRGSIAPEPRPLLLVDLYETARPVPENAISLRGIVVDLGCGLPPYDDARPSAEPLPEASHGFSDTVMRMAYRGELWGGVGWFGGVAAHRYQDEPLMEALSEPDLAWFVVGVHFEF